VSNIQQHEHPEEASAAETLEVNAPQRRLWKALFWQFLRYCLVGGINTVVDLALFGILTWCFPTTNTQILLIYNSFAYTSGGVSSFFLNKYWTFEHKNRIMWREVRRFAFTLLAELLYSNTLLFLVGKALRPFITNTVLWSDTSKLITLGGGVILSYTFMRFWTFAKDPIKHAKD